MRPWQFSRPKGPGFGISRNYYLSVLLSRAVLPPILEIINPKGEGGAAEGFGAPLVSGSDKAALQRPMERGAYAVATRDRKTVLKMLLMGRDEAGYDPEAFARSPLAEGADPELLARMRGAWTLAQFNFESHDPDVYPSLDFLLGITMRLGLLGEGVVADPISRRYRLPQEVFARDRVDPRVDARDHVAIHFLTTGETLHAFTLGMQKFTLPEYEIPGVAEEDEELAGRFLVAVNQRVLLGDLTQNGERFGAPKLAFEAREGGFNQGMWRGTPVFELIPPTGRSVGECLRAWAAATA